jgi:type IV pilus assembly protein PilZ
MIEQRRPARLPLAFPLEFSVMTTEVSPRLEGIARDLSLGAMFIETDILCFLGDNILVHLTLPGGKREMELPAVVRWTDPHGMGAQFRLLGARDTHEIIEFLARSSRAT